MNKKLIPIIGSLFYLTSCTHAPTAGEQMFAHSKEAKKLSEQWIQGEQELLEGKTLDKNGIALIKKGEKQISKGKKLMAKGEKNVVRGKAMHNTSELKIKNGHTLKQDSETEFTEKYAVKLN